MAKKKEKKHLKWKKGEMDFIKSDFISFFLDPPDIFDMNLAKLEDVHTHPDFMKFYKKRLKGYPGVTPFAVLIQRIEESARDILRNFGHTTNLEYLYDYIQLNTRPVTNKHGFTHMVCDLEPESIAAIRVLRLAFHLRDYLEIKDADKAALTTMRIMFAAFNMEAGETLMRGIKALAAQHRGAVSPKRDKTGYYLAIREIMRLKGTNYSRENMWRYLKLVHRPEINSMQVDDYEIWVMDEDQVYQRKNQDRKTDRVISKSTFKKYISKVRSVKK